MSQAESIPLDNGSPPRVWGKRRRLPGGRVLSAVHPHGCGENEAWLAMMRARCGSPPRVWGKLLSDIDDHRLARFTPTGVGKTRVVE